MSKSSQNHYYDHLKRITADSPEITAVGHYGFAGFLGLESGLQPDTKVARQRSIELTLGSGALNTLFIECLTDDGAEMLSRYNPNHFVGQIITKIETDRAVEIPGDRGMAYGQFTTLGIKFYKDSTTQLMLDGKMPLDGTMETETRAEWLAWGVDLHYRVSDRGGEFAMAQRDNFTEVVGSRLASIE